MSYLNYQWNKFLDWLTCRRLRNFTIQAVSHFDGKVQRIERHRDQWIVFTDYAIYSVNYNYYADCMASRRIA